MTLKVIHKTPICSFNAPWLVDIIDQYLTFEPWSSEKTYALGTVFYVNCLDPAEDIKQLIDQGFRVVVDNLWEVDPGPVAHAHRVVCNRWFWYNESQWYRYLNYNKYQPNPRYLYRALMPMNKRKPHRDEFVQQIDLTELLWSYVETGIQLPGDKDMSDWNTQRFMNSEWYDSSYMSMVVESLVRPASKYTPVFITEKTFKPIAFQHPFVVYGHRNTLQTLHNWGFETFDNLWDESYDQIVDVNARRHAVIKLINSVAAKVHDAETSRRLLHNRNHFFDQALVQAGIIEQILEPILEYAETNLQ